MKNTPKPFMNPYLAGFLLGLVLLASFVITGRGLGASGAAKDVLITAVGSVAPQYASQSEFYDMHFVTQGGLLKSSWLVFLAIGVVLGGFISGAASHRLGFTLEKGPNVKASARVFFAIAGGLFFGLGAQFGRGCTSGAALSGMAVLSYGGILTMMTIFGSGYLIAYFFRKLWI